MLHIAVITTLYKSDRLDQFEEAIRSIEQQTLEAEIRIYLCIDGPVPETYERYLSENEQRFFKIVKNPENIGLALSLNRLIDILEGEEFVFRMDGDDISLPERFDKQRTMLLENPELDLIGSNAMDIDDDGNDLAKRTFLTDPHEVKEALAKGTSVLHPSFCVRGNVFERFSIRYPDAHLCEDLAFLVTLTGKGGKIANHPDILLKWRTGANFFNRRRDCRRGYSDMAWCFRALHQNGNLFSKLVIFPPLRFVIRIIPLWVIKLIYASSIREKIMVVKTTQKTDN